MHAYVDSCWVFPPSVTTPHVVLVPERGRDAGKCDMSCIQMPTSEQQFKLNSIQSNPETCQYTPATLQSKSETCQLKHGTAQTYGIMFVYTRLLVYKDVFPCLLRRVSLFVSARFLVCFDVFLFFLFRSVSLFANMGASQLISPAKPCLHVLPPEITILVQPTLEQPAACLIANRPARLSCFKNRMVWLHDGG